ncbi:hypothetical protein LJC07_00725 [Christensenellaceae bacterium OttesenSCG-928-L17]|nr:hypothetical protein [Christensenellaceae bacterium OttesenSCG-928-L17]
MMSEQSKFNVILADPPWRYARSKVQGAAEKHYPTIMIILILGQQPTKRKALTMTGTRKITIEYQNH